MRFISTLFVFLPLIAGAQDNSTLFSPKVQSTVGKLIKIHGQYPQNDISTVFEADLNWTLRGARHWHDNYENIEFGVSLSLSSFGNDSILGKAYGVIPYFGFKRTLGKRSFIGGRLGLGLAYFNKPFDHIKNPDNLVIGSSMNAQFVINSYVEKELSKDFCFLIGVTGWHYSNIHLKVPNIGANIVGATMGLKYTMSGKSHQIERAPIQDISNKYPRVGITAGLGLQAFRGTIRPNGGPLYPVYSGSGYIMWPAGKRGFWSSGVIFNYLTSSYNFILHQALDVPAEEARKKSSNVVAYGAHEWMFGHFSFQLLVGLNLYDPFTTLLNDLQSSAEDRTGLTKWTANKISVRYYPLLGPGVAMQRQPVIGMSVKAAGGSADFYEMYLGFVF